MKSKFPGYFKLNESEISSLWDKALFTLDANILLNLYRYSDETKENFFKILEKIKDRVWIPHQSAQEFFDNRLNEIGKQEKAYDDAVSALNSIETEFKNSRQHPFISSKLLKRYTALSEEICKELTANKEFHNRRINDDDILVRIEELFNGKVGNEFDNETIDKLCEEGKVRFANKIPPGYKDSDKKDDTEKDLRKYGDLIVWKQILAQAKELKVNVILVTDDRKEDWWVRFKGKTVSPRPELIKEFQSETEQLFHMYQSDRFLEFAGEYFKEAIDKKALDEIRELRLLDERKRLQRIRKEEEYIKYRMSRENLMKERMRLSDEIKFINDKRNHLEERLKDEYVILDNSDPSSYDDHKMIRIRHDLKAMEMREDELTNRLKEIEYRDMVERKRMNKTLHNNG
ncbi:PIN-like domain-containing protein [Aquaticitalea lipolytica]|mgnify:CR=1 FL=1|uniref:PIN-like domain-containing protein n=1 Tax=Aquaticitalea lipolytica TaxID=1247562 RepID=UPI0024B9DB39|nr:PIN-like domain-containing protein [Aquaticitalea lipolytica]